MTFQTQSQNDTRVAIGNCTPLNAGMYSSFHRVEKEPRKSD